MCLHVSFFVAGTPVPEAGPRAVRGRASAQSLTHQRPRELGNSNFYEIQTTVQRSILEKSIALKLFAEVVCPGNGSISAIRRDVDSHCKAVLQALNLLAFDDDSQIIDLPRVIPSLLEVRL